MLKKILLCCLLIQAAHAQTGTPSPTQPALPSKPSAPVSLIGIAPPHPTATTHFTTPPSVIAPPLISTRKGEQAIQTKQLHISTEISGGLAQTTVEMTFFNPNGRNLEGNLQFPLLDGQQIASFALDIEGKLRPAVPVEKARGQKIFEEIVRERVDPGLLEVTQGNNFKLRIFPIPSKGTRTVRLQYTEALARQDKSWKFRLPLALGARWQEFTLDVLLRDQANQPQVAQSLHLGEARFVKNGNDYALRLQKSNFSAKGELNLQLAAKLAPQIAIQKKTDEHFFVAEIPVSNARVARPLPKRIGLLWDSSGSSAKRNLEAELFELALYFKAVANAEVNLTVLRETASDGGVFKIVNGNWDSLRRALQKTVFDGASALSHWQINPTLDEYLLVSDGLSNFDRQSFPQLASKQRLYALSSAVSADSSRLAAWAEANGGKAVQVNPHKLGSAAQALLTEAVHIEQINAIGARDVVFESREAQNGLLRIAGKLLENNASVTVQLSHNGKPQEIKLTVNAQAALHPFAANLWAQYKLRNLDADFELHRAEIGRIGKQFGIPTRETSLLVLERLEDYVRHEVTPPPELAAAVASLMQTATEKKLQQRTSHLDKMLAQFRARVAWWEKDFPKGHKPKPREEDQVIAHERDTLQRGAPERLARSAPPRPTAMMAAPAPSAPPPPSPSNAAHAPKGSTAETAGSAPEIGMTLKKWTSNAPYIARLRNAKPEQTYAMYLDEKPSYANSSAFYLDVAELFFERGNTELAVRVLSNLAEMDLENRALLRILGLRLLQAGKADLAIPIFEKVLRLAPEEPQSLRDLALALAANQQFQAAVDKLNQVIEGQWDVRFPDIEGIALAEMNALIATAPTKLDTSRIDPRLLKNLPLDIRVVMTWDADNSDMDLWVTDPNGERCAYNFPLTYQGGRMSKDFTNGYGPEEFSLKTAKPGKYKIETNFYGNRQQVLAGATTLQVKLFTAFGSKAQQEKVLTLRLQEAKETVFVGEFEVK